MSYESTLEAAGMRVIDFRAFGSYQGDWFALVEYEGRTGFVSGSYGSCSGCDAFEAEMGDYPEFNFDTGEYEYPDDYQERLADFGRRYLPLASYEETLREAARYDWDPDSDEQVAWVKSAWESATGTPSGREA